MIQAIRVYFTPGLPQPPERCPAYLRWLKRFPCVACASCRWIDPAHFGPHGHGTKASDYDALPLCRKCHDEQGKSALTFAEMKGLDVPALQKWFRGMWAAKQGRRAA
jgi:hypothetical protein